MALGAFAATVRGIGATACVLTRHAGRRTGEVDRFATTLAELVGVRHALAVNSPTSALVAALVGAGVGPGDEVLVPAYARVSTAAAARAVGAVPVPVEVDASLTIDPHDLERRITARSRAVIPVHVQNLVCDMDAIMAVAGRHGLTVIEDACQALGLRHHGRRVGSIGHVGCVGFDRHENARTTLGGALLTDDGALFDRAAAYHDVGGHVRYRPGVVAPVVGVDLRMPELCAAVLRPRLATVDAQLARRRRHRRIVADALGHEGAGHRLAPHHDPFEAAGLAVTFDDDAAAVAFADQRGVRWLADTGRGVPPNRRALRAHEPAHPRTLEILARTCVVDLFPELPTPAVRRLARRYAAARPSPVRVPAPRSPVTGPW